jgi:hypothetical protein
MHDQIREIADTVSTGIIGGGFVGGILLENMGPLISTGDVERAVLMSLVGVISTYAFRVIGLKLISHYYGKKRKKREDDARSDEKGDGLRERAPQERDSHERACPETPSQENEKRG